MPAMQMHLCFPDTKDLSHTDLHRPNTRGPISRDHEMSAWKKQDTRPVFHQMHGKEGGRGGGVPHVRLLGLLVEVAEPLVEGERGRDIVLVLADNHPRRRHSRRVEHPLLPTPAGMATERRE
jgi:hypothetical protein